MDKPQNKKFKISSALKDIIGKDLITNDFIAVFELVKNAYDANATRVDLRFEGLSTNSPRLIIRDDGKGMDRIDIEEKWLFVAYSAKKLGTEDFRDKISSSRRYAGAKGIGRFSCDRLGRSLVLYTKKRNDITYKLFVNWESFEKDMNSEFASINIELSAIDKNPIQHEHGTMLLIQDLRSPWDRDKLLSLKRSLEKLLNPNPKNQEIFSIYLDVPEESQADKEISHDKPWDIVNGVVKNFIFEKLELKTTQIYTSIDSEGKEIVTRLMDRGEFVYEVREYNSYTIDNEPLKDVEINLFSLNISAKQVFARHMGMPAVSFGSVFLYKNGFRINPIGDPSGGDVFGLDRRKQQGQARYLGTRDLIGKIEIHGLNPAFQETSSRAGGLVRNDALECLEMYFKDFALRRLERYAVDVIKFGNTGELLDQDGVHSDVKKSVVMEIIESLTRAKSIIDIKYNPNLIDIINDVSEKSLNSILTNFSRIAIEANNPALAADAERARQRLLELEQARAEAEAEASQAKSEKYTAEKSARYEAERAHTAEKRADVAEQQSVTFERQSLYFRSMITHDVSIVESLHHHIGIAAGTIENYVTNAVRRIRTGKPVTIGDFQKVLERISHEARKIKSITGIATRANFALPSTKVKGDLVAYIGEYILNINSGLITTKDNTMMVFIWKNASNIKYEMSYKPLEIAIILDNLISNSRKAGANTITLYTQLASNKLSIIYEDDGTGVKSGIEDKIFDLGFTTTDGSGLGLYQVSEMMREIGGTIEIENKEGRGARFRLTFGELS